MRFEIILMVNRIFWILFEHIPFVSVILIYGCYQGPSGAHIACIALEGCKYLKEAGLHKSVAKGWIDTTTGHPATLCC